MNLPHGVSDEFRLHLDELKGDGNPDDYYVIYERS